MARAPSRAQVPLDRTFPGNLRRHDPFMRSGSRLVVFDLLIPRTDDRTGVVHPNSLFIDWTLDTAERFGGVSQLGANIQGFWFDSQDLVEDHSHLYRLAVQAGDEDVLKEYVKQTAVLFGQRCLYLQRSGEAELVWANEKTA